MSFSYHRSVTVAHGKVPNTNQANFAVMVIGPFTWMKTIANGGRLQNGNDFRVYSDAGLTVALDYEVVPGTHSLTTGAIEMWVRVPLLTTAADYVFYIGYGDASVTTDGSTTGTWNSSYQGVWHLPNGTTLTVGDSTSHANNGTAVNSPTAVAAQIDGGAHFVSSSSQSITVPAVTALTGATMAMFSAWFKRTSVNSAADVLADNVSGANRFGFQAYTNGVLYALAENATGGQFATSTPGSNDTAWHLLHVIYDGTQALFTNRLYTYIDGVAQTMAQTNNPVGTSLGTAQPIYFGRSISAGGSGVFDDSTLDEIHLWVGTVPSADWIVTEFNNQSSPSTFYAIGSEIATGVFFRTALLNGLGSGGGFFNNPLG